MRIYCDSVILIYFLEGNPAFKARATARLAVLQSIGDILVTSDLVRLECRMHPMRLGDTTTLGDYDLLFGHPGIERVVFATAVFDRATIIRATYNFKLGDSPHLAAAAEAGCDRFLTNDARLSRCTDIAVEVLS
jgi:predicted nucleic acid-binding protein